ncbi:Rho guanine nucleotide exchange factor [Tilletia horrida]|nr:Rho guanine nucleotide exchange factor [Tilletia horrida]KAK0553904.1 Rho guanine nucleotide exchange factor [Tilletia horrida]
MAGYNPRPLPPMPGQAAPGAYNAEDQQYQQQPPPNRQGMAPGQPLPYPPGASHSHTQSHSQHLPQGDYAWAPPMPTGMPYPAGQWYPQAEPSGGPPAHISHPWNVHPAHFHHPGPAQQPAPMHQHQSNSTEAARPDPLALLTFQDHTTVPATTAATHPPPTAALPGQRPPLPAPPINGRTYTSPPAQPPYTPAGGEWSVTPVQRPHVTPTAMHAHTSPPTQHGYPAAANLPSGWSVQPISADSVTTGQGHVATPLPHVPFTPSGAGNTSFGQLEYVASPLRDESPAPNPLLSSPYSRPGSISINASPSPRPAHQHTDSGSVQHLAQQLAASRIHDNSSSGGDAISSNPWDNVNGNHEAIEQLSAHANRRSFHKDSANHSLDAIFSNPASSRPTSTASYFSISGAPGSNGNTPGNTSHSGPPAYVPQHWSLVPSGSSHSDGLLAPPLGSSAFSSPGTSFTTTDESSAARDDDDRVSILSLGSRRAAFSKDLADPDFLANMGIIARDVPVREHAKGSLVYPDSFTGRDLINTLQDVIPVELFINPHEAASDEQQAHYARLAALQVADALREQHLFHEVEWEQGEVIDSDEALYAFSDERLVRVGPAPRRTSSYQSGARPTNEPERTEAHAEGSANGRAHVTRNGRGPQRSKTMQWSDTITPELRSKLGKYEIQRQNATLETIEREEQFLADLELLQELFVDGLKAKSVIAADEMDDFVKVVFGNHRQLASHIRGLVEELHVRQAEHDPEIREIGDLFLNAALGWGEEYCSAITNYPFAANRVQKEEAKNPAFRTFLEECLRNPKAQRLSLTTFLYRPVVRLQRYHLHFKAIMEAIEKAKAASENAVSRNNTATRELDNLNMVSSIIHTQVENAQRDLATSQYKVDIANFAEAFAVSKRSEFDVDMDLLNPERQLKHKGMVFLDGVKMQAILFDNYFVLAKEPKTLGDQPPATQRLVLAKRPIPVELLKTEDFNSQSVSTSLALKFIHLSSSARKVSRQVWPFKISHRHRKAETFTLTVSQESARREWQRKFDDACNMRKIVQEAVKAWTVSTINDDGFATMPSSVADWGRDSTLRGNITATCRFNVVLEGQKRPCVAIATDQGVFVGSRFSSAVQKVLNLKNVTQVAVMDQLELLFVLVEKVLWVCRLVDLFAHPHNRLGQTSGATLQQISTREEEVLFFGVGVLDSIRVLVYAKKKPYDRGTAFVALETMLDPGWAMRVPFAMRGVNGGPQFRPFGNGRFECSADVHSMQFRRKGLCLSTARGFELCNLGRNESPRFLAVPEPPKKDDLKAQALLKRIKAAKPMSLFKITDSEFLLCYNTFGCFVNADRTIARDSAVLEWETEPEAFIYRSPYLIAIDPGVVEIRVFNTMDTRLSTGEVPKALSGRLLQFFSGEQMSLLNSQANDSVDLMPSYDAKRPPMDLGVEARDPDQDAIILKVLKRPKPENRSARTFQAVVEVVPLQYTPATSAARR